MTKIADVLKTKGVDPRRVIVASRKLETRTAEDTALVAKKKAMKDGKAEKDDAVLAQKPRSGRPVTGATMAKALEGRPLSGPAKTRITRAVNAVLAQKKKPETTLRELF